MKCPYCNKRHPVHFKFCPEYGKPLCGNTEDQGDYIPYVIIKFSGTYREALIDSISEQFKTDRNIITELVENMRVCLNLALPEQAIEVLQNVHQKGWAEIKQKYIPADLI